MIYAILKQKPYNLTTNTVKAYLSTQSSSLSGFVISKTRISGQKPHRRQVNAKVSGSEIAIFCVLLSFFVQPSIFQQRYLENGLSHFNTKLMLITVRSSTTTQHLLSLKFTLVNKSHSQQSEAAVHCLGHHFLILYACAREVSFPDQRPQSLVWKQTSTQVKSPAGSMHRWHGLFPPRKAYEHHVGKALHSVAYL